MGFNAALKRKGRLAAGMLAFAMAFSAVIGTQKFESKAAVTEITFAGVTVQEGYYLSNGTASDAANYNVYLDADGNVTLRNANITSSAQSGLQLTGGGKVTFIGSNTIRNNGTSAISYGLYSTGDLVIEGASGATLNVTGGTANGTGTNDYSYGISAGGNITFQGEGTVNATGGTCTGKLSIGVGAVGAKTITIGGNAKVNANGGTGNMTYGIYAGVAAGTSNGASILIKDNPALLIRGQNNGIYCCSSGRGLRIEGFSSLIVQTTGGTGSAIFNQHATSLNNFVYAYQESADAAHIKSNAGSLNINQTGPYIGLYPAYTLTVVDSKGGAVSAASSANDTVFERYERVTLTEGTPNAGYTFGGWTSNDVTNVSDVFEMPANNVTVTANWDTIPYNITYNLDGGTVQGTANPTTYNVETPDITLNNPTKEHYTFDGWYVDDAKQIAAPPAPEIPVGSTGTQEFWAKYTPIDYNIDYQMNGGGDKGTNPNTYNITDVITLVAAGLRTDYNFEGWFSDNNTFNNKVEQIGPNESGDKTLYAKWKYVGNININGTDTPVTEGDVITLPTPSPAPPGQEFDKWEVTPAQYTGNITDPTNPNSPFTVPGEAVTLTPTYKYINYTVKYENMLATDTNSNPAGFIYTDLPVSLSNPTRSGTSSFEGWYTDAAFNNKITEITNIPAEPAREVTVYAKWVYTGPIDVNGTTVTGTTGDQVPVTLDPGQIPEGYEFDKWVSEPDYTPNIFDNPSNHNTTITFPGGYAEIKPTFRPIDFAITYNVGEGKNAASNPASYNIESETITLAEPTITGFYFGGWYTDAEFKNPVTRIEKGSMGNRTLYAKWDEYKITMGQGGIHRLKSGGTLSFTATGHFKDFTEVLVDNAVIDTGSYNAVSGSTVVTLTNEYLDTLSVGTHSITVRYNNGEASTTFEVQAAPLQGGGEQAPIGGTTATGGTTGGSGGGTGTNVVIFTETGTGYRAPKTFDETSIMLMGGAGLAAAVSLIGMAVIIKKRREYRE